MKVLIDSSVWIDHLRACARVKPPFSALLTWLDPEQERGGHEDAADLFIGDLIQCEVLRGIPDPREHAAVKDASLSSRW